MLTALNLSQVAFIFDPEENEAPRRDRDRPAKRRKTARRAAVAEDDEEDDESSASWFSPLLNGTESAACVQLRERLLEENWAKIDARIQVTLVSRRMRIWMSVLTRWIGHLERLKLCDAG